MDNDYKEPPKIGLLLIDGLPVKTINGIPVLSVNGVPTQETLDATAEGQAFINSPAAREYAEWYQRCGEEDGSDT